MCFVNLMNFNSPRYQIPKTVFEDLKLFELLNYFLYPKKDIEIIYKNLSMCCDFNDIEYRNKIFKIFEDEKIYLFFNNTCQKLEDAFMYFNKVEAEHYKESSITYFLKLYKSYVDFIEMSAKFDSLSSLFSDYSKPFKDIAESDIFKQSLSEYNLVSEAIKSTGSFELDMKLYDYDLTNFYMLGKPQVPYLSTLNYIKEKFGVISEANETKNETHSPEIIYALSSHFPDAFKKINIFYDKYKDFINKELFDYIPQFNFFISIYNFFLKIKNLGIPLCSPKISSEKKIIAKNVYDISLLSKKPDKIIPNDIDFCDEGFFILTGANGGGKTTYLRSVGILMLLFLAGGLVPAESAEIYPFYKIFTHFPVDESFDVVGRLKDETIRADIIAKQADENSLILFNETFSSTNAESSLELSKNYIENLCIKGSFGIFVTHLHKLSESVSKINSNPDIKTNLANLSVTVNLDDNNKRTYKIEKKAGKRSYAQDILDKYGLSSEKLKARRDFL